MRASSEGVPTAHLNKTKNGRGWLDVSPIQMWSSYQDGVLWVKLFQSRSLLSRKFSQKLWIISRNLVAQLELERQPFRAIRAAGTESMAQSSDSALLSDKEVQSIIKRTIESEVFEIREYEIKAASENITGFLGEHFKIKITVGLNDSDVRTLFYFVKTIPRSVPQHLEYALATRAFYKEIQLYQTLFVDLKNAQNGRMTWCPEFFYSRGEELLVIEDLSAKGYYMLPERTLMDEDHVRASLRAIAAMHASSFVFQDKFRRGKARTLSPNHKNVTDQTVGELYSHLTFETEVSDEKGHPGHTFIQAGISSQVKFVDSLENYSDEEKVEIKKQLPKMLENIMMLVKPSQKYENVFIHGDLWSNNILFRKGGDGKVKDAVIVDFQLARYAPPAHDLMMFIYLVQNKNFREKKERELLDYYYECFSKNMADNNISAESVLPQKTFYESCDYYRELGLLSAVLYFQLIILPSDISEKFMVSPEQYQKVMLVDRSELIKECFERDDTYRNRMTGAMNELISTYIL